MEKYTEAPPRVCCTDLVAEHQDSKKYDFPIDKTPFNGNEEVVVFEIKGNYFAIDFYIPAKQVLFYELDELEKDQIRFKKHNNESCRIPVYCECLVSDKSVIAGKSAFTTLEAKTTLPYTIMILQTVAKKCEEIGIEATIDFFSKDSQNQTGQHARF